MSMKDWVQWSGATNQEPHNKMQFLVLSVKNRMAISIVQKIFFALYQKVVSPNFGNDIYSFH